MTVSTHTLTPSGSPHYFAPILHYLRCGVLELPPGITRTSLLKEAEFYGLQKIVDHITHVTDGEKKKKEPAKKRRALWIMIEA